jgi:N-acetylglucosamine-6-phosphate deacetylase
VLLHAGRALVEGRIVADCTVRIVDDVIAEVRQGVPAPADADAVVVVVEGVLAPGFIDLHVHALDGAGLLDADTADAPGLGEALVRRGVTGFLATTVTAPIDRLEAVLAKLPTVDEAVGARFLGAHLEGPWLSGARPGAQPARHLTPPTVDGFERLLAAGPLAMLTLAPELPGALEVVRAAAASGVVVAMGHSDAGYDEARHAMEAGARHVTHCFNAMSPMHHRQPGLAGAALDLPGLTVEAIADGAHLHPAVVRLMWRARGPESMCLVSDAVDIGDRAGQLLRGADGALRRDDGVLAGTGMGLDTAVRNVVGWGIPLADALVMASTTPATVLGRADLGRLAEGAKADVVVLDADLSVHTVVVAGLTAHERDRSRAGTRRVAPTSQHDDHVREQGER